MQYTTRPQGPLEQDWKVVQQDYKNKDGSFIRLNYSETLDGSKQTLSAFYFNAYKDHLFNKDCYWGYDQLRFWALDKVPKKYQAALLQLRLWVVHCPVGHKLTLA